MNLVLHTVIIRCPESRREIEATLPYRVAIPGSTTPFRFVTAWLIEQFGDELATETINNGRGCARNPEGVWTGAGYYMHFKHEADAFAFKIRWG